MSLMGMSYCGAGCGRESGVPQKLGHHGGLFACEKRIEKINDFSAVYRWPRRCKFRK
jgi:hypothetical protein